MIFSNPRKRVEQEHCVKYNNDDAWTCKCGSFCEFSNRDEWEDWPVKHTLDAFAKVWEELALEELKVKFLFGRNEL